MRVRAVLAFFLLTTTFITSGIAPGIAPGITPGRAQTPGGLAAHEAAYELTFGSSRGGEVQAARGTMGYDVVDTCDGWAVRQRLKMIVVNNDGQEIQMESDYSTWEAKDGLKFRFHVKQMTDTAVTSETDGEAMLERVGGPGEALYAVPKEATKVLPAGTYFPMAHTLAILTAAREGKKFVAIPLFDGTDENGAQDSSVAILDWKPPFKTPHESLTALPSTKVRLAFFDRLPDTATPSYEVGLRYWENGVADDMQMDFGDFVMQAKIARLTMHPSRC